MRVFKYFVALGVSAGLIGAAVFAADGAEDKRFESLGKRYLEESPAQGPVGATFQGDHRFDSELDQISPEAREGERVFLRRYLDELAMLDRSQLSRANQVDALLLENSLRYSLWQLEEHQEWAWNPTWYTGLTGGAVYSLMAREFAPLERRLSHVADRLEQFPRLLEQIQKTLDPARVPQVHAETAVSQNRGVLSILGNTVEPHLDVLSQAERQRLEAAIVVAKEAIERHQAWLEESLLPNAKGDFRIGAQALDKKLAFSLQSDFDRAEIKQRAEQALAEFREQMYQISQGIYTEKYPHTSYPAEPSEAFKQAIIRGALEVVYEDRPARDGIVETAERFLEQSTEFVRQKKILTLPDDPVEIIVMPEFRRGVSLAYCDSPGPLDVGQKTFYAVSPLPEDWTAEQATSFLREYNDMGVQVLTIHEAMPGHFVQLAHSNRYPSTLRALLSSGLFIEGWAEYIEMVMREEGYLDNDPRFHLIVLKLYLRSLTNSLLDQGIHADGMTRKEAMDLMMEKAFQEEREAAGKWVRAQLSSAQLSTYFTGYLEHTDLRRAAEERAGDQFDLQKHHDQVLSFGSPPVRYVRQLMFDLPIAAPE